MNRIEAQGVLKHLEVVEAFAAGAEVECRAEEPYSEWLPTSSPNFDVTLQYRVKPLQAKYRRYLRRLRNNSHSPDRLDVGVLNYAPSIDTGAFARNLSGFVRWIDNDWVEVAA